MPFIPPMLASPLREPLQNPSNWTVETKLDGHRLVVCRESNPVTLFSHVEAFSRYGKVRDLPLYLAEAIENLPPGVYDGELIVPGSKSYGVTRLDNQNYLAFVVFDMLSFGSRSLIDLPYTERRKLLVEVFEEAPKCPAVSTLGSTPLLSQEDINRLANQVWEAGGEGLILKRNDSVYKPGKRSKHWLKIKQLLTAVLKVYGFIDGKWGANSILLLVDDEGNQTRVKAKDLKTLAEIQANPRNYLHRLLRIEYQERTPDGSYRHPRWDRWENE